MPYPMYLPLAGVTLHRKRGGGFLVHGVYGPNEGPVTYRLTLTREVAGRTVGGDPSKREIMAPLAHKEKWVMSFSDGPVHAHRAAGEAGVLTVRADSIAHCAQQITAVLSIRWTRTRWGG